MDSAELRPGEPVYHPKYGFGVVLSIRDQGIGAMAAPGAVGAPEAYYEIEIARSGTLFVPTDRAGMVGLRRLTNSVGAILACLASDGGALPQDTRERLAWLRRSEQAREPAALVEAVRDLLTLRRSSPLSNPERKWLDVACRRLSAEAAIIDRIPESEAHAAITAAVAATAPPVMPA